ncbi:cytochrome P450 [Aspergillus avenaceus]|uniref:Cytochrome P450 n=1 Tax=Aspergillus avenaceus TaxID=36643 RepID=A0A5N6U0V3_ASPAV|nr:cytochrome P450 [Aspergillus avenaceus]
MYALAICLVLGSWLLRRWFALHNLHGPWITRITNLWQAFHIVKGDLPEAVLHLHRRYGPIVRIGPHHVSIADPEEIKNIYRLPKGEMYQPLTAYVRGKKIMGWESIMDESLHSKMRRPVAPYYRMESVIGFEPKIEQTIDVLDGRLNDLEKVDIVKWIPLFVMDAMSEIGFSKGAHAMEQENDTTGTLDMVMFAFRYYSAVITMPRVGKALNYIAGFFVNPKVGLGSQATSLAHARYDSVSVSDKHDLLGFFIEASKKHPMLYDLNGIVDLSYSTMLTGISTTVSGLILLLHTILKHPVPLSKLQSEVDRAVSLGEISYPPKFTDVRKLPYLDAVIKEAIRHRNVVRIVIERNTGPNGVRLCGQDIPPGTTVGCLQHAVHHHIPTFGNDAHLYRPERWLECTDNERAVMERSMFVFGYGSHQCVGQNIVRLLMYKLVVSLLLRFEVHNPTTELATRRFHIMTMPDKPLFVRFKRRSASYA